MHEYTKEYFEAWSERNLINFVIAFGIKLGEPVEIGEFTHRGLARIAARMANEKMRCDAMPIRQHRRITRAYKNSPSTLAKFEQAKEVIFKS